MTGIGLMVLLMTGKNLISIGSQTTQVLSVLELRNASLLMDVVILVLMLNHFPIRYTSFGHCRTLLLATTAQQMGYPE